MASAGNLVVKIISDQSEFVSNMRDAGTHLDEFGNVVKNSGDHLHKFNINAFMSRGNLRLLGEAAGVSLGPIHHMIEAIKSVGPVYGGILAAGFVLHAAFEDQKKDLEDVRKGWVDYGHSIDKTMHLIGVGPKLTPHGEEVKKSMEEEGAAATKLRKEIVEINESRAKIAKGFATSGVVGGIFGYLSSPGWFTALHTTTDRMEQMQGHLRQSALLKKELEHPMGETGGGLTHGTASIGSRAAGVYAIEHSATTQIGLLQQINSGIQQLVGKPVPNGVR